MIAPISNVPRLPLWSFHRAGFSLVKGRVCPELSEYYNSSPGIAAAYHELWRRFGTDQLVWCCARREDFEQTSARKVEWALSVPRSGILAFLDNIVWNRIIGATRFAPPVYLRRHWNDEAILAFPGDRDSQDKLVDQRFDEFWNEPPPKEGWWAKLFLDGAEGEATDVLLRHPIARDWLLGSPLCPESHAYRGGRGGSRR